MSDSSYSTKITREISQLQRMLLDEHRSWRALELKSEMNGLVKALEIYYAFDYNTSQPTIKEEEK